MLPQAKPCRSDYLKTIYATKLPEKCQGVTLYEFKDFVLTNKLKTILKVLHTCAAVELVLHREFSQSSQLPRKY